MNVTELTQMIKESLENDFSRLRVEGEISNYRPASSGHVYFSLKDENALINAVLFRSQASRLTFRPQDGQKVTAIGRISVYPPRGNYQIVCTTLAPAGEGNLLQILEDRKQKLAQEGLFDEEKKRPLPSFPHSIAVVTSPTGAALQDILQVLKRRNARTRVTVVPCPVQGMGAAEKIAAQIRRAGQFELGEVIIVARGGGSLEDLLPFYEECVVRAVADSPLPVISGVGHEIDFSLTDLAADFRAPTPSAAAEVVSSRAEELKERVRTLKNGLITEMENRLKMARLLIKPFSPEELEKSFYTYLEPLMMRLDDGKEDLLRAMESKIEIEKHRLELIKSELIHASPLNLLERGFARVTDEEGKTVLDASKLSRDDELNIRLMRGSAKTIVKEIYPNKRGVTNNEE